MSKKGLTTLKMKVVHSFQMSGSIPQPQGTTTKKTWFLNMKNGLQQIMSFSLMSLPAGSVATVLRN
jgi:hypothetical protein